MTNEKTLQQLIADIKTEVMTEIIWDIRKSDMTTERAHDLAKDFLALFPITDFKDLFMKLQLLSKKYKELEVVFIKYSNEFAEGLKQTVLQEAHPFIQNGDIETAIKLIKGGMIYG